jgi:hypothetical protein
MKLTQTSVRLLGAMPPLPFTDIRSIGQDLLQPFDRWALPDAPQVQWNDGCRGWVVRSGYEDTTYSSGHLTHYGDVLIALRIPDIQPGQNVVIACRAAKVPCHRTGEWWILDAPIVILWTPFDVFAVQVDGAVLKQPHTARFIMFETEYRNQADADMTGDYNTLTITYPSCILNYSHSELQVGKPDVAHLSYSNSPNTVL